MISSKCTFRSWGCSFPRVLGVGLALLALTAPPGCGAKDGDSPPAPGAMRITSVEKSEAPLPPSRLANGNFADWPEGEAAPKGFQAPAAEFSSLTREAVEGGGFIAVQKWTQNDVKAPSAQRFGVYVEVRPNTHYVFEVAASTPDGGRAEILAFEALKDGSLKRIGHVLQTKPSPETSVVKADFVSGEATRIFFESGQMNRGKVPCTIAWHSWALREIG